MRVSSNDDKGFTLVELVVVMGLLTMLIGLILTGMFEFYRSNITTLGNATQLNDTRTSLHTIQEDLSLVNGFMAEFAPATTPLGSDNNTATWNYKGTSANRVLISQTYATSGTSNDDSRALVYANLTGCSPASTTRVKNTIIYFVKDKKLFRRTIVGQNGCTTPDQRQSCSFDKISMAACKVPDATIMTNVSGFGVDYYTEATDTTPINVYTMTDVATANSAMSNAKAVVVTIKTTTQINGSLSDYSSSLRVNRFNP